MQIRSYDFASLYPHLFFSNNLYSDKCQCCSKEEKYTGRGIFKLKGAYCSKKFGKIETAIRNIFLKRLDLKKKGDPRQYPLKIVINTAYGLTGFSAFYQVYNITTAGDCTYMARECLKYAIKIFKKNGYGILYGDTDSLFIEDPFDSKKKSDELVRKISEDLKGWMQFPQETFNLAFENEIKAIFFFKSGDTFIKKNYIYITDKNKMIIKGLPIIKSNVSKVAAHLFTKFLKRQIMETYDVKFYKGYIMNLIHEELEKNIVLASQNYKVRDYKYYEEKAKAKDREPTGLHAEISKRYGSGTHRLIPNNKFGIGQAKKYCTVEEFKEKKLNIRNINIEKALSELEPFIKNTQRALF